MMMATVSTEAAGGCVSTVDGEREAVRTNDPGTNRRGCAMAVATAMGGDGGRRLAAGWRALLGF